MIFSNTMNNYINVLFKDGHPIYFVSNLFSLPCLVDCVCFDLQS